MPLLEGLSWRILRFVEHSGGVRLTAIRGTYVADITVSLPEQGETSEEWLARVERALEAGAYDPIDD